MSSFEVGSTPSSDRKDIVTEPGARSGTADCTIPWSHGYAGGGLCIRLAMAYLYKDLRHILPEVTGRVLDVACGDKLYARGGFSAHGLLVLFEDDCQILDVSREGAVASTCIVLALNWLDTIMGLRKPTRILKGVALPFSVLFSGLMNAIGFLLDRCDRTDASCGNVQLIARKVRRSENR